MSHNKLYPLFVFVLFLSLTSSLALGQDDENLIGFDSIVSELNSSDVSSRTTYSNNDPFAAVLYHAGVGIATSQINILRSDGKEIQGFMKGIEINLGIDLFSKKWRAEGSFRNFSEEKFSTDLASLKEFDLKLSYQSPMAGTIIFRSGGGLAARYLTYSEVVKGTRVRSEYTTPSSLFYLGMGAAVTPMISLAAEISYRSAMIDETADLSAVDAAIRLDAKF